MYGCQRANAAHSKARSAIEHVFSAQKSRMATLAYNFKRLVWHAGRRAPA